jgi:hypothetical protein
MNGCFFESNLNSYATNQLILLQATLHSIEMDSLVKQTLDIEKQLESIGERLTRLEVCIIPNT